MLCDLGPGVHPELTSYLDRPLPAHAGLTPTSGPLHFLPIPPRCSAPIFPVILVSTQTSPLEGLFPITRSPASPSLALSWVFPSQGGRSVAEFLSLVSRLTSSPDMEGALREKRNLTGFPITAVRAFSRGCSQPIPAGFTQGLVEGGRPEAGCSGRQVARERLLSSNRMTCGDLKSSARSRR